MTLDLIYCLENGKSLYENIEDNAVFTFNPNLVDARIYLVLIILRLHKNFEDFFSQHDNNMFYNFHLENEG